MFQEPFRFNIPADELIEGMLLKRNEVFRSLASVLPEVESILYADLQNLTVELDNLKVDTRDVIQNGLFNHASFVSKFNIRTLAEIEAVNLWEKTKYVRNLSIAILIGIMMDYLRGRVIPSSLLIVRQDQNFDYHKLQRNLKEVSVNSDQYVSDVYLQRIKELLDGLNLILKQGLRDVIASIENIDDPTLLTELLANLKEMVQFSNKWSLTRRPGTIHDVHEFISRGIDSMTFVPYQCIVLIRDLSETPLTREALLNSYSKSYPLLAIFASGDREILGLTRRFMEKPEDGFFDSQMFKIGGSGGIIPDQKAFQSVEVRVRRLLLQWMIDGSIWSRGIPREVTYCPAVVARHQGKKNVIREIFDWSLELFAELNQRHTRLGQVDHESGYI
jgi:hypothetical protein